jgi:hypothetical protein
MRTHLDSREGTTRCSSHKPARALPHAWRRGGAVALALLAASTVVSIPRTAQAEEIKPTAKGIVGTALLGAEVVVFAESIFGVQSGTAYLVGAGAGAVAGGIGGYFIEQQSTDGRVPTYLLAGGLALLVPAIVVTLDATRFRAAEGAREDRPTVLPPSDPGKPGGSSVLGSEPPKPSSQPATPAAAPASPSPSPSPAPSGGTGGGAQAPLSLLEVRGGAFRMGLPLPEVRPLVGSAERKAFGVQNGGSEVRFPVMRVAF